MVATILGLLGAVGFIGLAIYVHDAWLGIIAVYMLMNCWGGMKHAQDLLKISKLPSRDDSLVRHVSDYELEGKSRN